MKNYIQISKLNLIIFDEAHWVLKKDKPSSHPYRLIMNMYKKQMANIPWDSRPRILGLTASILNPQLKMDVFYKTIDEIEKIYNAKVESEFTDEYFKEARVFVEISDNIQFWSNLMKQKNQIESIEKLLNFLESKKKNKKAKHACQK